MLAQSWNQNWDWNQWDVNVPGKALTTVPNICHQPDLLSQLCCRTYEEVSRVKVISICILQVRKICQKNGQGLSGAMKTTPRALNGNATPITASIPSSPNEPFNKRIFVLNNTYFYFFPL